MLKNYRRVWIIGHYRNTSRIGNNGKKIKCWVQGYWRLIKIERK